jgi:hypothetical protein
MDTILHVHSQLGADGWRLLDFPDNDDCDRRPENAIALYQKGEARAWLTYDGTSFHLEVES